MPLMLDICYRCEPDHVIMTMVIRGILSRILAVRKRYIPKCAVIRSRGGGCIAGGWLLIMCFYSLFSCFFRVFGHGEDESTERCQPCPR